MMQSFHALTRHIAALGVLALSMSLASSGAYAQALPATAVTPAPPAGVTVPTAANMPYKLGTTPLMGANYQIHSGDLLNVQVYGEQGLSQNVQVLGDGTIQMPLVGQVNVGGKTPVAAAGTIKSALTKYIRHPIVTVAVAQQGENTVLIFGDVKTPGRYALHADAHLTDAIAAAGGLGPTNGDFPPARVSDAKGDVHSISLQHLLHDGDSKLNIPIDNGAIVYVPGPATYQVEVTGSVDHPGEIELNEGDRLSMAIAKAGNSANAHADLNHIRVTRVDATGHTQATEINLYQALEHGDMRYDPILAKGDIIFVPQGRTPGAGNTGGVLFLLRHMIGL